MTPAPAHHPRLPIPTPARKLIAAGALVAINTSGGKDSQAMTILLARHVPLHQLVAVHAPLTDVEWPGTVELIRDTLPPGIPLILAPIASGETLLQRIERRGKFPDPKRRWCTSDFKRTPIERELRRHLKANPRFRGRIINAMGLRRDESAERSKRNPWTYNNRNSKAGRAWYDWLPIFEFTEAQVFGTIATAGQTPHPVYSLGLTRCSCSFCIFGSASDLATAARLRPDLYRDYAALERRIEHTLSPSRRALPEITGIHPHALRTASAQEQPARPDPCLRPLPRSHPDESV